MRYFSTAGVFCTVVYSRELWEAVEGYNSTQWIGPDAHFIHKVLRRDPVVVYVNRPLYCYRTHEMGQAQQQAKEQVIKVQVDRYNYLIQYDDDWLRGTGVTRDNQRWVVVNRELNTALVALASGSWLYASRLLAFAGSAYPSFVLRHWKGWVLALLLACGPFGVGLARLLRSIYNMNRKGQPSLGEVCGSGEENQI